MLLHLPYPLSLPYTLTFTRVRVKSKCIGLLGYVQYGINVGLNIQLPSGGKTPVYR